MAYDNKPICHPKYLWLVFHMMFVVEALSLKQCAVLSPLNLRGLRTAHSQRKRRRIQPANPLPLTLLLCLILTSRVLHQDHIPFSRHFPFHHHLLKMPIRLLLQCTMNMAIQLPEMIFKMSCMSTNLPTLMLTTASMFFCSAHFQLT